MILMKRFFAVFFFLVSITPHLCAASLSSKTLTSDLGYYRKISREQNLDANSRSYVLLRIKEKYTGSKVDISPVIYELNRLGQLKNTRGRHPEQSEGSRSLSKNEILRPKNGTQNDTAVGRVEKVLVFETPADSRIAITVSGDKRSNYFLLRDPDPSQPPKIVLDLYGVKDALSKKARDIRVNNGLFSRVQAGQFEGEPDNIVRIAAQLKKDRPYKIKKEEDKWLIIALKDVPAAAPVTAQPAPLLKPAAPETDEKVEKSTSTNNAAAQQIAKTDIATTYHIEPGDVLSISVYPADELSREVVVQQDGRITFPLLGSQEAKGTTPEQLGEAMSKNLGRYIAAPQVSVTVRQFSRRQVFITGEVHSVGAYSYKENMRLLEFISSSGGFTENADRREVKIYRGPPTKRRIHTVNVDEIMHSGDFSKDFLLEPGDIIEISKGRIRVAVLGDVHTPGYYDYKENMQLIELISLAGGFNDSANISGVNILHPAPEGKQTVTKANLKKILTGTTQDVVVMSGDTVYVPKKSIASAGWFMSNILPWISLVSLVFVIRAGI